MSGMIRLVLTLTSLAFLSLAACAPAAPPTPTPPPPKPAPAATQPAAPVAPKPAAPAPTATAAPKPAPPAPTATAAPKPAPPTAAPAAKPKALEKATLRLPFKWTGIYSPFVLAVEKGYYAELGVDLTVQEGTGSADSVKLVAAKSIEFALADASTMMAGVIQDVPVRMAMGYTQVSPLSLISLKESGITKPKDLEGKTIAGQAGGATENLLPAFYKATGVDENKVKFAATSPAGKVVALLEKKADLMANFVTSMPEISSKGKEPTALRFYDYGLNMLSIGLIAHPDTIKNRPDLVRKVVAGSVKGMKHALEKPAESIAAGKKQFPEADVKADTEALAIQFTLYRTKRNEGKQLGWMAKEDWTDTEDILNKYGGLKGRAKSVDAYFTNEFVPN